MVTNNKLKTIKPNITPWINFEFLNRKESVIITRLRIGHSHLTHKYLLDKTPQPRCTCGSQLSIQHIFSDCIQTSGMRRRYNLSFSSLSSNDVNVIKRILSFLMEARLFDRIWKSCVRICVVSLKWRSEVWVASFLNNSSQT